MHVIHGHLLSDHLPNLTREGTRIQRLIIFLMTICVAAYATPSPEPSNSRADAGKPVSTSKPIDKSISKRTVAEGPLEVVDVPEIPVAAQTTRELEMSCRREQEIGSRRVKRICRTRAENNQEHSTAEDALERLRHMNDVLHPGVDLQ
jgi:hypothetical protein